MTRIFKIIAETEWQEALAAGMFRGSAVDMTDGFIHFSDENQVRETAARHFAGMGGLLLIAFEASDFGVTLKWEASRGGALFPHLYAALDPALARWSVRLPWDGIRHVFPDGMA